jgi:hypothetical protein
MYFCQTSYDNKLDSFNTDIGFAMKMNINKTKILSNFAIYLGYKKKSKIRQKIT